MNIQLNFDNQEMLSTNPYRYDRLTIQFNESMIIDLNSFRIYPDQTFEPYQMDIIPFYSDEDDFIMT